MIPQAYVTMLSTLLRIDSFLRMENIFSSSGPEVLPVKAARIGIKISFAFKPVFLRTISIR